MGPPTVDLSVWVRKSSGKPLGQPSAGTSTVEVISSHGSSWSPSEEDSLDSDASGSITESAYHLMAGSDRDTQGGTTGEGSADESDHFLNKVVPEFQHNFYVEVPSLSDEQKESYEYLPGHFSAKRILSRFRGNRYLVRLGSGETNLVSARQLRDLNHGEELLKDFTDQTFSHRRRTQQKPTASGVVDRTLTSSDSEEASNTQLTTTQRRYIVQEDSNASEPMTETWTSGGDDKDTIDSLSRPDGRRSERLRGRQRPPYFKNKVPWPEDLSGDDVKRNRPEQIQHQSSTRSSGWTRRRRRSRLIESSPEPVVAARRSERTKTRPHGDMRERHEDDISARSEEEAGPKIVGTKESFERIPKNDPFRKRHRQECDTCCDTGDNDQKGPLVLCQGCTNSYHKSCLGPRGSRDHLVTKVGENSFLLQCRSCIGVSHEKDSTAPHHGVCVACHEKGALSTPLRARLTTRQEQIQRDENDGHDPIAVVEPGVIGNIANVMFRCATCQRAWHLHHLPEHQTAHSRSDDKEKKVKRDVDGTERLARERFDLYSRSWMCKDCVEHQSQIDVLVAWRPVDIDAYTPGDTADMMAESQKEYLVKWRTRSYFRTTWMPGTWVWGVATRSMRAAFLKKPHNQLPKMTATDAIPEEYFRVDIVFDVRYTSGVHNSTEEIDLARVKEVDMAYVKYKGLGYDDAIWERPPSDTDTERWNDFKDAYDDYVRKCHLSIPRQNTLRRHLASIRGQDFEQNMMREVQPSSMTGGQLMLYQMDGLNWLMYQWATNQNAILADEMGLGKTIQVVAFFATLVQDHQCWPFLVVVPNSTCPNWRREIKKWVPSLRVVTCYGSAVARKLTHDYELFPKDQRDVEHILSRKIRSEVKDIKAHVVVASYESIVEEKTRKSLLHVPWQGLVVDEGQRLKSDRNQVYEILSKFRFPFKILLTGTPLQNNARELFNLLQFLDESVDAAEMETKYANLTQENVPELHETLRKFLLRRTKAQVLTSHPPMAQMIVPVSMSTLQKKVYRSILAKNPRLMKSIFSRGGPVGVKERHNLNNILMQLRKTLCHPFVYSPEIEEWTPNSAVSHRSLVEASSKLQLLQIMLPTLRERGRRVLLFSQFLDNLDVMEDFLDGLGLPYQRLDGSISAPEKQKRIDAFNAPDSPYFAFLLSTRAGGVGINLATADTVIILDPDFNPHQDIQALSRAHRIGQKHKVLVFQLMTRGTVEEKMMQIGKKKMALDHVLIESIDQDDAGVDLESILRHGAEALFDDHDGGTDDIVYDAASIDRLLDRSLLEDTKTSADQSAESQFSFARVWAHDRSTFASGLQQDSGTSTPNPGLWDKILQERERAHAEEMARNAETLGRGKRKRQTVDYGGRGDLEREVFSSPRQDGSGGAPADEADSDADYQIRAEESEGPSTDGEQRDTASKRQMVKGPPFKRVKIPNGPPPDFNGGGVSHYGPMADVPPTHLCSACHQEHPIGWCRLQIAGVEHCGLSGPAHLGHGRTCPHLNSKVQVAPLFQTLKESTESRALIEQATQRLRMIRGDLVPHNPPPERKEQESTRQRVSAERPAVDGNSGHIAGMPLATQKGSTSM